MTKNLVGDICLDISIFKYMEWHINLILSPAPNLIL